MRDRSHLYCLQWANYTMRPKEQNQHYRVEIESRYMHTEVSAPKRFSSLDGKHKPFLTKKGKNGQLSLGSDKL